MQEFILAETSETLDRCTIFGEVSSELWVYRLVASIEDDEVAIYQECGLQWSDYELIDFEVLDYVNTIDFNKKDFNPDEVKRFNEALICK